MFALDPAQIAMCFADKYKLAVSNQKSQTEVRSGILEESQLDQIRRIAKRSTSMNYVKQKKNNVKFKLNKANSISNVKQIFEIVPLCWAL